MVKYPEVIAEAGLLLPKEANPQVPNEVHNRNQPIDRIYFSTTNAMRKIIT